MWGPRTRIGTCVTVVLVVCHLWIQNAAAQSQSAPPNPVERESAIVEALDVYAGLEARVFTQDPTIVSPTNIDVDHRGRVWICDVANYGPRPRTAGDRIMILEDTDGDGRAETAKVFYQGPDVDAAMGICVLGNRCFVTSAPNVLVLTDDDGDDKADRKEFLFTKTGKPRFDHSIHSVTFGPDGRFYWNMGNTGNKVFDGDGEPVIDQFGQPVADRNHGGPYLGGMVMRFNADLSDFEVLAHNFRNNYELTVDSFGNVWQSDNDDDGNYGCRLNYILEYGNYGYQQELTGAGWRKRRVSEHSDIRLRHWHQNDPGVVPNFAQTGAGAPSGITIYEGELLPDVFRNEVIHCDAGPGVVWAVKAKPDGAGYHGTTLPIMKGARDRMIRPVDVAVGPDGSLFISDWYDPVLGWVRQADKEHGRIYRIAPVGHVANSPALDLATPEGAVEALKSPNGDTRYLAWTALEQMHSRAEPALVEMFKSANVRWRARALWLLCRLEGRTDHYVNLALDDSNADVRLVGLRAARQLKRDLAPLIARMTKETSSRVLAECAIALRHVPAQQVPALWSQLADRYDGSDRWYLEALGIGAEGQWDQCLAAWLSSKPNGWSQESGRRLIWRSRSSRTAGLLSHILVDSRLDLEETRSLLRAFDFQADDEEKRKALTAVALLNASDDAETLTLIRTEAFLRLAERQTDGRQDARVQEALGKFLQEQRGSHSFVRLVRAFELREYFSDLVELVLDASEAELSADSLSVLLDHNAHQPLERILSGDDPNQIASVVRALSLSRDARTAGMLESVMLDSGAPNSVREDSLRGLCTINGKAVLSLAASGRFPEFLKPVAGAALAKSLRVDVRTRAAEFFPMPATKGDQELPQMTELLVFIGDAQRGGKVFESALCSKCHLVLGTGTNFGPDLSEIGEKLSKQGLYESILDPDASVSESYKSIVVALADGRVVNGFRTSETDSELVIRSEGGKETTIDKNDIEVRKHPSKSLMPADLHSQMTLEDLIDVVEYLTTLRRR